MSKWIVDIHGDIEGDYELIEKYKEPKTGYWIGGDGHYICSCCRRDPEYFLEPLGLDGGSYMAIPMDYCPHCGAKMQGERGKE